MRRICKIFCKNSSSPLAQVTWATFSNKSGLGILTEYDTMFPNEIWLGSDEKGEYHFASRFFLSTYRKCAIAGRPFVEIAITMLLVVSLYGGENESSGTKFNSFFSQPTSKRSSPKRLCFHLTVFCGSLDTLYVFKSSGKSLTCLSSMAPRKVNRVNFAEGLLNHIAISDILIACHAGLQKRRSCYSTI